MKPAQIRRLETEIGELKKKMQAVDEGADGDILTEKEQEQFDAYRDELTAKTAKHDRLTEYFQSEETVEPETTVEPQTRIEPQGLALEEDPKRGFQCMGDFGSAVQRAMVPGASVLDERLDIMTAISGNSQAVGSEGGFLVPPVFSTEVWDGLLGDPDSLLAGADTYTVTGDSLTINANAETSRADGSRWGGIRGYWIAEGDQLTTSKPKLRQVKLEPQQLAVMCYATDKLLKNAQALEQWLTRAAISEINFKVGDAIINGDGVGKPLGILSSGAVVSQAKETGQAAASVVTENVSNMWARLHPNYRAGAQWFINQEIEPKLDFLTIAVGTGGAPVYMPAGGISESPYGRLKARPVVPVEYCQAPGTAGDIILANMQGYAVGMRGGVESAMSMHLRFDYNETAFRFLFEVDGRPWLESPLTPFKGTKTLSTFVKLAARS